MPLLLLQGVASACCGMIFNTKGFAEAANSQVAKLEASLIKASEGGKIPIVCDTSPCLGQIKGALTEPALKCAPIPFVLHSERLVVTAICS